MAAMKKIFALLAMLLMPGGFLVGLYMWAEKKLSRAKFFRCA